MVWGGGAGRRTREREWVGGGDWAWGCGLRCASARWDTTTRAKVLTSIVIEAPPQEKNHDSNHKAWIVEPIVRIDVEVREVAHLEVAVDDAK